MVGLVCLRDTVYITQGSTTVTFARAGAEECGEIGCGVNVRGGMRVNSKALNGNGGIRQE